MILLCGLFGLLVAGVYFGVFRYLLEFEVEGLWSGTMIAGFLGVLTALVFAFGGMSAVVSIIGWGTLGYLLAAVVIFVGEAIHVKVLTNRKRRATLVEENDTLEKGMA